MKKNKFGISENPYTRGKHPKNKGQRRKFIKRKTKKYISLSENGSLVFSVRLREGLRHDGQQTVYYLPTQKWRYRRYCKMEASRLTRRRLANIEEDETGNKGSYVHKQYDLWWTIL